LGGETVFSGEPPPAARLQDKQYGEIAAALTRSKWPDDPAHQALAADSADEDPDRWWDFKPALEAAELLQASFPAMLRHWKTMEWSPKTRGGYKVISDLAKALDKALPYIEWPFAPASSSGDIRPIRSETRLTLVTSIACGRHWLDEIVTGIVADAEQIAVREKCSVRKVNMTISLAFLSPTLVIAAIDGTLPRGIGVARLRDAPAEWSKQYVMLGSRPKDQPA
jgi:hypothetical protein